MKALEETEVTARHEQRRQGQRQRQDHQGRLHQEREGQAGHPASQVDEFAGPLGFRVPEPAPQLRDQEQRDKGGREDRSAAQIVGCDPGGQPGIHAITSSSTKAL
jgi:hypothetical protein